jgi:hypothetical protein
MTPFLFQQISLMLLGKRQQLFISQNQTTFASANAFLPLMVSKSGSQDLRLPGLPAVLHYFSSLKSLSLNASIVSKKSNCFFNVFSSKFFRWFFLIDLEY